MSPRALGMNGEPMVVRPSETQLPAVLNAQVFVIG